MQAPVVSLRCEDAFFMDLTDVHVINWDSELKNIIFGVPNHSYRIARSIQDMVAILGKSEFLRIDKRTIVNVTKALGYDKKTFYLTFDNVGINQQKSYYVAEDHRPTVKKIMGIV